MTQPAARTDPGAIRDRLAGLEEVGVDEVYLWPQLAAVDQVSRLRDALET